MSKYKGEGGEINFYKETLFAIETSGKTVSDIEWIGTRNGESRITWEEFVKISDFKYPNNVSVAEIDPDLIILFKDESYFERKYHDYTEGWELKSPIKKDSNFKPFILQKTNIGWGNPYVWRISSKYDGI